MANLANFLPHFYTAIPIKNKVARANVIDFRMAGGQNCVKT